jgi:hypothetical protein
VVGVGALPGGGTIPPPPPAHTCRGWHLDWALSISYARWGVEAFFHAESLPYRDHYMVAEVSAPLFGYTLDRFALDIALIVLIGAVLRVAAYVLLVNIDKHKQR